MTRRFDHPNSILHQDVRDNKPARENLALELQNLVVLSAERASLVIA